MVKISIDKSKCLYINEKLLFIIKLVPIIINEDRVIDNRYDIIFFRFSIIPPLWLNYKIIISYKKGTNSRILPFYVDY